MLPFDKGGVVGPDLKVYNVEGLRIVDASGEMSEFQAHSVLAELSLFSYSDRPLRSSYGTDIRYCGKRG